MKKVRSVHNANPALEDHSGHGQFREPCIWGAGRGSLQRVFTFSLLPSALPVQPLRGL